MTKQTWKRIFVFIGGFSLLLIGIAMIVLPGPALVVIPLSLVVLGAEFVWARDCLAWMKRKMPRFGKSSDEDAEIMPSA